MRTGDTIVALSTAPGWSARAMVRLSGPGCTSLAADLGLSGARTIKRVKLPLKRSGLPVLASYFVGPASYTGEDVLEIQLPGSPHLVHRVLQMFLSRDGVRLATPGEFTARAWLNDRLTLEQAEGVASLIAAASERELAAAGDLLNGVSGDRYRIWADELASMLALVEAGIDFTDQEDVVPIAPAELAARLLSLQTEIDGYLGAGSGSRQSSGLVNVVLYGRPNAGKSTLFNALLGRRRSVTSSEAETTRDVITERLEIDVVGRTIEVDLTDLAGLDESNPRGVPGAAREAARLAVTRADVLVHCDPDGNFDASSRPPVPSIIRVRTMGDLPGSGGDLAVCALDGWRLPALRRAIADRAFGTRHSDAFTVLPRHLSALRAAHDAVTAAMESFDPSDRVLAELEITAGCMRTGLDHLGELTGQITPDDVIGRVFATFCVGK